MREHRRDGSRDARPSPGHHPVPDSPAARMLALQRTAGNAVTTAMLARDGEPDAPRAAVHDVLRGSGAPMAGPLRREMEARLGADFSTVRVHTDAAARRSAAAIGARAYTSGEDVVVGDGGADRHTVAHELTHVLQQRRGSVAGTDHGDGLRISDPADRFEREAETTARRVMSGPPRR